MIKESNYFAPKCTSIREQVELIYMQNYENLRNILKEDIYLTSVVVVITKTNYKSLLDNALKFAGFFLSHHNYVSVNKFFHSLILTNIIKEPLD